MRIVVCAKEVLDPDAVNNFALAGRLTIGEDGRTITQSAIAWSARSGAPFCSGARFTSVANWHPVCCQ